MRGAFFGVIFGVVALIGGFIVEGGNPTAFLNLPASIIVFGGTFGAAIGTFGLKGFLNSGKLMKLAAAGPAPSRLLELRATLIDFADKKRKGAGPRDLEPIVESVSDPFLKRGLGMVVDGTEPDVIDEIIELDIESMQARHAPGIALFQSMGGYGPTMGIIGTVMGLVNVLSQLSSGGDLGHSIAVAFIATLLGVASANVLYYPIAGTLKAKSAGEVEERRFVIAGLIAIQSGKSTRQVAAVMDSLLSPLERAEIAAAGGK
jgi:chemotaxis protein MotA